MNTLTDFIPGTATECLRLLEDIRQGAETFTDRHGRTAELTAEERDRLAALTAAQAGTGHAALAKNGTPEAAGKKGGINQRASRASVNKKAARKNED